MWAKNFGAADVQEETKTNHWFFALLPDSIVSSVCCEQNNDSPPGSVHTRNSATNPSRGTLLQHYTCYGTFLVTALLALYTQVVVVNSANTSWRESSIEALSLQHVIAQKQHEQLARKFHVVAKSDHAALLRLENETWKEAQEEKQDAEIHGQMAKEEHELYKAYLTNATAHQERAHQLEVQATILSNQSVEYQRLAVKLYWAAHDDEKLEAAYLRNASREFDEANNITQTEANREDDMWICRWRWSRKYICGALGGVTALGDALRQKGIEDYQKAVQVERQLLDEKTSSMIAFVEAQQCMQKAKLVYLKAEKSHNISLQDQVKAEEEHSLELHDLQVELEDMHLEHEHEKELKYYEGLQKVEAGNKHTNTEHGGERWSLGTHLFEEGTKAQNKSLSEDAMAKQESKEQKQILVKVKSMGRRVRLYSLIAAAYALMALACFIVALIATTTVSLSYHVKKMFSAAYWGNSDQHLSKRRNMMNVSHNFLYVRHLSCWCHHMLVFMVAAAMQGDQLTAIYDFESWGMRGEIVLRFAVTGGILETLLFQAIPLASILSSFTSQYMRNVSLRLLFFSLKFAIQMLLLLVLCGQDSAWLFGWIQFLRETYLVWIVLLVVTSTAHFWFIEYPYISSLVRRQGPMSEATSVTCFEGDSVYSPSNLIACRLFDDDETSLGRAKPTSRPSPFETESLLTPFRAQASGSSLDSSAYCSISLTSSAPISNMSTVQTDAAPSFLPPDLQRLYEVSIQDESYDILAHVELMLLKVILLVVCTAVLNIAAHR